MGPDLPALIPLSILATYVLLIRINYVIARNKRRDAQLAMWLSVLPGLSIWILIVLTILPSLKSGEEAIPLKSKIGRIEGIALSCSITLVLIMGIVSWVSLLQSDGTRIPFGTSLHLHYKLPKTPILLFSWVLDEDKQNYGVVLKNHGADPVIIKSFQISVEDELIEGGLDNDWELAFEKLNIETSISNHLTKWICEPDYYFPTGQKRFVLGVEKPMDSLAKKTVRKLFDERQLNIIIDYEAEYGRKFTQSLWEQSVYSDRDTLSLSDPLFSAH